MTQKVAITTVALFIIGIVTFISVDDNADRALVRSSLRLSDASHGVEKEVSKVSGNLEGPMSERKKRLKGLGKLDRPDLFAQYHHDIRTRHGEAAPSYSFNYKVEELLKAKSVTSTKALRKLSSTNQLNWVERGPGNVSGRTRGLIVDPDDPDYDTWYAGSVGGGVWKTENAGQTWTELTFDLPNLAIGWLAMAPSNHDVIYAGTGEGFFNLDQINGSGIWKSSDRGATWDQLASTANLEFQNVTRIIVDPADANTLLVSTAVGFKRAPATSGIHRSTDGGLNWSKVFDTGESRVEQIIANPQNFNTQYATINRVGVIKSIDGGLTWSDASEGILGVTRMEIAIAPTDTSRLYVSAEVGFQGPSRLYISSDAGQTWQIANDVDGTNEDWFIAQGWYDNTIAVHPYDKDAVFVGGVDLFRLDMVPGADTTVGVQGIDFENTSSFLDFINFGGALAGGGIDFGTADASEFISIEFLFGPGKKQKAHRFTVPPGSTSGVPDNQYTYQDYVEVPFELWDIDNNQQLMVSFRDQLNNGIFELRTFVSNTGPTEAREYLFPQAVPYDDTTPSANIAQGGGHTFKQLYFMWPHLTPEGTWDPDNLPESTLRIRYGTQTTRRVASTNISDGRGRFGPPTTDVHVDHHNLILIPVDQATQSFRLVNANDGGVSFSDDAGETFTQPTNGYNTTQFYGVDKKNGANEFIGGMQDNSTWRSPAGEDASASSRWTFQLGGDGFETVWHYTEPNKLLGSIFNNQIFRSLNGGASWFSALNGLDDVGTGAPFLTKLAKSKQDPDLVFAVGESGVWRTDNFASNWTLTQMPPGWNGASSLAEVKISLVNPQIVWAGESMIAGSPLYVSSDGGLSFAETSIFPDVTLGRISGLETHPAEDNTAFALFSFANASKILRTNDLGQTWEDLSGFGTGTTSTNGFPDVAVHSLLVMPYDTDIIWAGTEIGIFESLDGGATWADANNGFPATLVYEMVIVNDQVVVATHGRGVWSVALPELAGYEPPAAVLAPHFNQIAGGVAGLITADLTLRSGYDSSFVVVDGEKFFKIDANAAAVDTVITFTVPVEQLRTVAFSLTSYKGGTTFKTRSINLDVFPLLEAQLSYSNDFRSVTNDFALDRMTLGDGEFFEDRGLQSPHPYPDALLGATTDLTAILKIPIIVAAQNATLSYDDIAIVQPGTQGVSFGEFGFRDFVIVEGSIDNGATWIPFADGYDARFDQAWLTAYNNNASGTPSMVRSHTLNMLDQFSAGDEVFVRFRLYIDEAIHSWGWVINNLVIQPDAVSVESNDVIPKVFSLSQNYPNPFNPTTQISYVLPQTVEVNLKIFNVLGQMVRALLQNKQQTAGVYGVEWDGKDDLGKDVSSGVYIYRIEAGDFVKTHKMMLLK